MLILLTVVIMLLVIIIGTNFHKKNKKNRNKNRVKNDEIYTSSLPRIYTGSLPGALGENLDIPRITEDEELKRARTNEMSWDEYNKNKYEGERINGKKHGKGIMYYNSGDIFEGEWKNGEWDGFGILKYSNGDRYEGSFKYGKFHGHGVIVFTNLTTYEGDFLYGKFHGNGIWRKVENENIIIDLSGRRFNRDLFINSKNFDDIKST